MTSFILLVQRFGESGSYFRPSCFGVAGMIGTTRSLVLRLRTTRLPKKQPKEADVAGHRSRSSIRRKEGSHLHIPAIYRSSDASDPQEDAESVWTLQSMTQIANDAPSLKAMARFLCISINTSRYPFYFRSPGRVVTSLGPADPMELRCYYSASLKNVRMNGRSDISSR